MHPVGVGVVGLGVIGQIHARNVASLESTRLVAVVDQVRERAESIGRELGAEAYTSIDEASRNRDIEARELCRDALRQKSLEAV